VNDLVKKQIEQLENEKKSWIIEGFPRTRVIVSKLNSRFKPYACRRWESFLISSSFLM
jgi:adenylate kinase family enzyme